MAKKTFKHNAGFTLLELMVATFVLTIGLVVMMGSMVSMYKVQIYADQEATASNWSNFLLEDLQTAAKRSDGNIEAFIFGVFKPLVENYNVDTSILDNTGLEHVTVAMEAVVDGTVTDIFDGTAPENPPNPIEIQVRFMVRDGERTITYTSSKMISY